jgi:hypothetical protein
MISSYQIKNNTTINGFCSISEGRISRSRDSRETCDQAGSNEQISRLKGKSAKTNNVLRGPIRYRILFIGYFPKTLCEAEMPVIVLESHSTGSVKIKGHQADRHWMRYFALKSY